MNSKFFTLFPATTPRSTIQLCWTYCTVFWIMSGADWLQGPYLYSMYESFGLTDVEIGHILATEYISAILLGTLVGALADVWGHKTCCVMYGVIYGSSCLVNHLHSVHHGFLFLGCMLDGVAISILRTAFESWLTIEADRQKISSPDTMLILSISQFGNSIAAILAGIVGHVIVETFGGSYVNTMDVACICLIVGSVVTQVLWSGNTASQRKREAQKSMILNRQGRTKRTTQRSHWQQLCNLSVDVLKMLKNAFNTLRTEGNVLKMGLFDSLFESTLMLFIMIWSPVMARYKDGTSSSFLSSGVIFSSFMVCIMAGTKLSHDLLAARSLKNKSNTLTIEKCCILCCLLSSASFALATMSTTIYITFPAFCTFELCCGMYYSLSCQLHTKYTPLEGRMTVLNINRILLNVISICVVLLCHSVAHTTTMTVCALLQLGAALSVTTIKNRP
eukprot:TRINITY_DN61104_c0_g1_i2.p1 TRINITY_DN61104_c0_g1~~TRINITY_DN61104_c0_g1_i2.p1  ORF type:complete len:448 (+),score=-7.28 TRINITY_DN61104_c0_g1_i2:87-1430(+)